ncbi:predicted protein [Sparassis crispa]|uniref:DUF300-domain-containing protein n=1 Tax=Sparassis crispa TaxID=139825 RepID=A0A401GFI2_9APHY|nr:predicted protein [Sparassis crispa]GBE80946.1 predicted protein [Sparassis crispa]
MADVQNGRCFAKTALAAEPPLIQNGSVILQAHHIGWIISGSFTFVAIVVSFWLIDRHLVWYTNKREQRYIVRILFMVPIYAVVSFASYLYWNHSTALLLIRDCYESTVLTAFFYLLLTYLSPHVPEQKEIFRRVGLSCQNDREACRRGTKPRKWVFPLSFVRWKPEDGLYFFQLMKWGVLQYCVIRPVTTLVAVVLNYVGLYCGDSWSPGWGHIYITVVVSISVSVAMYCLIQLYLPISEYLAPHKPLLKLFAIKAVVFLTFWQETFISSLEVFGVIKDTQYMTADNIATGVGAVTETFEMMLFAFLHIRAFTYKPYRTAPERTPRWRSLVQVLNFKETLRELWAGAVYMAHRFRGHETDVQARREAVLEGVFGKSRYDIRRADQAGKNPIVVAMEETVHVDAEWQWLHAADGQTPPWEARDRWHREKSDPLAEQIKKGLSKTGYSKADRMNAPRYDRLGEVEESGAPAAGHWRREYSWWRDIYARISGSEMHWELEQEQTYNRASEPRGREDPTGQDQTRLLQHNVGEHDYEDQPPPSVIRTYRDSQKKKGLRDKDVPLAPQEPEALLSAFVSPERDPPPHPPADRQATLTSLQNRSSVVSSNVPSSPALTDSNQSDSFLGRAFPDVAYSSTSAEVVSVGRTSSESHRTRVRLPGEPEVVPESVQQLKTPVFVQSPHRVRPEVGTYPAALPIPSPASTDPSVRPGVPLARPAQSKSSGRGSATMRAPVLSDRRYSYGGRRSTPFIANRYTPSRDRIVLPARLAPITDREEATALSQVEPASSAVQLAPTPSSYSPLVRPLQVRGSMTASEDPPVGSRGLRRSTYNVRRQSYAPNSASPCRIHRDGSRR